MIKLNSKALFLRKIKPFIKATAAGSATLIIFSVLSAIMYAAFGAPEGTDAILANASVGISAIISGFFCAGTIGKNGLLWGATGGAILLFICLAGAIITDSLTGAEAITKIIICTICGCVGGVVAVNISNQG